LAIDVTIFRCATSAIRGIVICHTTMAMRGKHNNQPKEEPTVKMPVTEAKQQATTSRHNKRMRGWCNTNASATTATGTMTMSTVTRQQDGNNNYVGSGGQHQRQMPTAMEWMRMRIVRVQK
jgi:hypothetical protein